MPKFSSDYICGCYHPDGKRFKLSQPFSYQTDINPRDFGYDTKNLRIDQNNNFWIDIPAGFVTDFASVPRPFWSLIPPTGTKTRAAVVHDYLYTNHPQGRPWADKVFLEAMKVGDEPWITRWICYWAVRIAGRPAWDATTSPDIQDKGWLN